MSEYLSKLIIEIERLKTEKRKIFFRLNEKISANTVEEIKKHFHPPEYQYEFRSCSTCGGYDIIIKWS